MEYTKPVIIAQNNENGSFAAGCPANRTCNGGSASISGVGTCKNCERSK